MQREFEREEPRICVQRKVQNKKLMCRAKANCEIDEVEETRVENTFHGRYKVSTHRFLLVCCSTVGQQQRLKAGVLSDAL